MGTMTEVIEYMNTSGIVQQELFSHINLKNKELSCLRSSRSKYKKIDMLDCTASQAMEKLLDWLTDVLQIVNDEYFTLIIKDISERMDELVWRQSAKPCYSKYNLDDIVVWHKGSPQFFIRHEDISECKYTNYPEVVVNNKTIAETIYGDNNRIILRCVILNNN